MTFWGKLIGFIFGWFVMGPLGAVAGVFIGAVFDQGLNAHLNQTPRNHSDSVQRAFFTATFFVMGYLAKADGRVSEDEIRVASLIMTRLELSEDLRKEAIHLFNKGKDSNVDLNRYLDTLWRECHRYHDLLRFFIEIQLEAALADGKLQAEEEQILLLICERLHVSPREFSELMSRQWASQSFHQWYEDFNQQYQSQSHQRHEQDNRRGHQEQRRHYQPEQRQSSLKDAYGVLGIPMDASQADIKKAYRRLMNQHHPDKLVSRGLPEEMLKLAKEKTQQISAAYFVIREAKGFR